ncbi:GtrA-like protein [Methyloversatilis universalis FAM5]|uniref:GtrA-like protein n=1 Tax=Methyloversatilis universalis (strain ATCC BAA-1314 / DSM 25237 / JCM 13912 / CCUG 52030 / FAM5) TaxID=1000565 RepID=F5RCQ0_METUF|nr:GtrA family protein [Methyloversatilis universalis]EGK71830.1 GtrA-like protein [Methyloversatilis universalis FAM5]
MRASVLLFLIVGGCAAATHYFVTLGVDWATSIAPAWSNLIGFLCAFPVSYLGHRNLSFAGTKAPHRTALPKLMAVSGTAFVGNQIMLAALLEYTPLPLWLALGIVLVFVALSTWLLGRYWAFAQPPA